MTLKNNEGLQAYFSQRVQKMVTKHGKSMVGWDEVFVPALPKDIVIQSWRGRTRWPRPLSRAIAGFFRTAITSIWVGRAARHYAVDPMGGAAANLTPDQQKLRILGGESCMWSEYVNAENIDSRIWPRNAAIAERLWSPQSVTDPAVDVCALARSSARGLNVRV